MLAIAGTSIQTFAQVGTVPGCPGAFGTTKIVQGYGLNNPSLTITTNTTWTKDTIYILKSFIRVGNGATLTVQAGTIVMGFPGPIDTSALIIERGAKLNSLGTSSNPVIFTSCKLQGTRSEGDWGGLVINGNSIVNNTGPVYPQFGYGGSDTEDNSGAIQFTRIEFAGRSLTWRYNNENNYAGLVMLAVGAKTVVQNVQVSYSLGNSFLMHGGTFNARNLISWKPLVNDFKFSSGYQGLMQFGIAYRDFNRAYFKGSNGIDSQNDALASNNSPVTKPIISNFEFWGPIMNSTIPYNRFYKTGAFLHDGTTSKIYNSLFLAWPGDTTVTAGQGPECSGIYIKGSSVASNAVSGSILFKKNAVSAYNANPTSWAYDNDATFNAQSWFATPAFANTGSNGLYGYIQQKKAPLRESPLFALHPGAALLTGSSFTTAGMNADLPIGFLFAADPAARGFQSVAYRGATAGSEWAEPWAEYNPILFKYTAGVVPTRQGTIDAFLSGQAGLITNDVVCSPNPAVQQTTVSFAMDYATTDGSLAILDLNGSVLFSQQVELVVGGNQIPLNTTRLQVGTYVVRVLANGTTIKTAKLNIGN